MRRRSEIITAFRLGSLKGRPGREWEDIVKIDAREIGFGGVDWIYLAQYR